MAPVLRGRPGVAGGKSSAAPARATKKRALCNTTSATAPEDAQKPAHKKAKAVQAAQELTSPPKGKQGAAPRKRLARAGSASPHADESTPGRKAKAVRAKATGRPGDTPMRITRHMAQAMQSPPAEPAQSISFQHRSPATKDRPAAAQETQPGRRLTRRARAQQDKEGPQAAVDPVAGSPKVVAAPPNQQPQAQDHLFPGFSSNSLIGLHQAAAADDLVGHSHQPPQQQRSAAAARAAEQAPAASACTKLRSDSLTIPCPSVASPPSVRFLRKQAAAAAAAAEAAAAHTVAESQPAVPAPPPVIAPAPTAFAQPTTKRRQQCAARTSRLSGCNTAQRGVVSGMDSILLDRSNVPEQEGPTSTLVRPASKTKKFGTKAESECRSVTRKLWDNLPPRASCYRRPAA